MKEEEERSAEISACFSSETQGYEVEFIKTYEQLPVLWDVKHPDYSNKYRRGAATDVLLKIMKKHDNFATRRSVGQKINVLRSCYRKDLRKYLASKSIGPDGEEIFEHQPKNWKFYALRFLGGKLNDTTENIKHSNSIVEIDLDNTNFQDDDSEESANDSSHSKDVLQNLNDDKAPLKCQTNKEESNKKRAKFEIQEYFVDESTYDREFEAIGANVACKLKRMNQEQRCHADLLINKVLIEGLKNNLTDDTDLTEVYK